MVREIEKSMKSRNILKKQTLNTFFRSIRFRLVLWFVLILALVMGVFSAFVYWRQAQDVRAIAVGQLNFTLERFLGPEHEREGVIAQAPVVQVIPDFSQSLSANLQASAVVSIQGSDGAIQQSFGALTPEQIQQLRLPQNGWTGIQQTIIPDIPGIDNNRYLFIKPSILQNGQTAGYLLVGVPLDPNNQLGRLVVSLVLGNLLTLAIALTGGFWLADRAMRPVHAITQTARQISETDLQKRIHLPGKDELSELGNTFDEMLNRLQTAFDRQRQFTADASHELRTPLTIINLEASRGLSSRRSTEEYDRVLHTIQSENQFMIRLVNNLLALARMDAGQVKLKTDPLDLSSLILEVIERTRPLAEAKGVKVDIGKLQEIRIKGDHPTLVQMLTNLVENAIKFSVPTTDPQVQLSAGKRQEAGRLLAWVRVKDNGVGIPADHQAHIFDRFYQVDRSRNRTDGKDDVTDEQGSSGTGLGLAIAQWIAQAHHGEIRVESVAGQGSTFEVLLPADEHAE